MIHRKSTHELVKDINEAGGCSHPIRLRGEFVNVATGEVNERPLLVACKDRRAVLCPSCSYLYKADAWIVVSTGLIGGKGVPASISDHPRLFLTLTAPRSARSTPAKATALVNPVGSASANTAASSPVRDTTTTPTRRSAVRSVTSVTASRTRCSGTRSPHVSGTGLLSRFDVAWPSLSASLLKSSHSTPD